MGYLRFLKVVCWFYILLGICIFIGPFAILLWGPLEFLTVYPNIWVQPFFDNSHCGNYSFHIISSLCKFSDPPNNLVLLLFLVAIVLGILGIKGLKWIKEGKRKGHIIWITIILLAFIFTIINVFASLGYVTDIYFHNDFQDYAAIISVFWSTVYLLSYLRLKTIISAQINLGKDEV
jgi:hypothetical protein